MATYCFTNVGYDGYALDAVSIVRHIRMEETHEEHNAQFARSN